MVDRQFLQQCDYFALHSFSALHLDQQRQELLHEHPVLADDSPRVRVIQNVLVYSRDLELLDVVGADWLKVDVLRKAASFGRDLELGYLQVEGTRRLDDDLPNLHVAVDDDVVGDVVGLKHHGHLLVKLFVILPDVFRRQVHEVEALDVVSNDCEPVEPLFAVAIQVFRLRRFHSCRNLVDFLEEALTEDLLLFLVYDRFDIEVNEEVSTLSCDLFVPVFNANGPEGLKAVQF